MFVRILSMIAVVMMVGNANAQVANCLQALSVNQSAGGTNSFSSGSGVCNIGSEASYSAASPSDAGVIAAGVAQQCAAQSACGSYANVLSTLTTQLVSVVQSSTNPNLYSVTFRDTKWSPSACGDQTVTHQFSLDKAHVVNAAFLAGASYPPDQWLTVTVNCPGSPVSQGYVGEGPVTYTYRYGCTVSAVTRDPWVRNLNIQCY